MSVQKNHYVLWGVKLKYKDSQLLEIFNFKDWNEFAEKYDDIVEPYTDSAFKGIKSVNGISLIDDGMDGKYTILGYILNKSNEYGNDLSDYTQPFKTEQEVETMFLENFNIELDIKLITITHYR